MPGGADVAVRVAGKDLVRHTLLEHRVLDRHHACDDPLELEREGAELSHAVECQWAARAACEVSVGAESGD